MKDIENDLDVICSYVDLSTNNLNVKLSNTLMHIKLLMSVP